MAPNAWYSSVCCVILEQLDRISPTPFTVIIKKISTTKRNLNPLVGSRVLLGSFSEAARFVPAFLIPIKSYSSQQQQQQQQQHLFYLNININITTFVVYLSI